MAAFSLTLEVAGGELSKFGDIQITRAVNGLGLSGVCTTQMTFKVPAPLYAYRAATVKLGGIGGLPTLYISQRSQSKGVVTVTCLDRTAFLDEPFPIEDFTAAGDSIALSDVMQKIVDKCGFSGWGMMASSSWRYPTSLLQGATCLDILNRISEVYVGVWWCNADENLQFVSFPNVTGGFRVNEHTAVDFGAEYEPAGVCVTDKAGVKHIRGSGLHKYDTITVDSELASKATAEEVYSRIKGKKIKSLVCDRCKIYSPLDIPPIVSYVSFKQFDGDDTYSDLRVNNIVCSVNSQGIFATIRCNEPANDEIGLRGRITTALNSKARYGEYGNAVFNKYQGWLYVEEDEPSGE